MKFGKHIIGPESPTFIIGEIGANHDGNVDKAIALVDMAIRSGVDAVKLQTYTASDLVADVHRIIRWGPPDNETEEAVGSMFERITLSFENQKRVLDYAKSNGMTAFSTPFSIHAVHDLFAVGVPGFKFASSDVNYHELLIAGARTGLPVLLSLGKSSMAEAALAIERLSPVATGGLALLHCVAQYPAPVEDLNLRAIGMLAQAFPQCIIGYSDHSIGITAAVVATAMGACIVEKHITLDKGTVGPDHWFSADESELASMVQAIRFTRNALGSTSKFLTPSETVERHNACRSLVSSKPLRAGEPVEADDVKVVRPGWGIPPYLLPDLIGLAPYADVDANTVLTWDLFKSVAKS
jgi:N,N'-diacetyllegionaminate synthase